MTSPPADGVAVIRSLDAFAALRDVWDALAARRAAPVLEHAWVQCGIRAFHRTHALHVVTVWRGGRLVAAAPLVVVARRGVDRLELVAMSRLQEPGGLLYEDDAALDRLASSLVSFGLPLILERLEGGSAEGSALRSHVRFPGAVVIRPTASTLLVRVRESWADYTGQLSSRITVNLPRLRRRAARVGAVRVETLSPAFDETASLLEDVMAVEASGWKGRGQSSLRARPDLRGFFSEYADTAARAGRLRIARLWVGTHLVAVELAVVAYGRWWQLKIGYDETFAEYYPGLQLTYETIRYAFEQGLEAYEFLGSAASWERRWNADERGHELVVVYPAAVRGMGALLVDALAHAGRKLSRPATNGQKATD